MLEAIDTPAVLTAFASVILCFSLLFRIFTSSMNERSAAWLLKIVVLVAVWIVLQSVAGLVGLYRSYDQLPPRIFAFGVGPTIVTIIVMIAMRRSREILMQCNLESLTLLHIVRIPVEFGLYQLAHNNAVPSAMTFEGGNYDILAGVTAPLAMILFARANSLRRIPLLVWNVLALVSLFNIVSIAIRATPIFSTHLAFERPNLAIFYFPWVLLPTFIVPTVLFAHVVAILKLLKTAPIQESAA